MPNPPCVDAPAGGVTTNTTASPGENPPCLLVEKPVPIVVCQATGMTFVLEMPGMLLHTIDPVGGGAVPAPCWVTSTKLLPLAPTTE